MRLFLFTQLIHLLTLVPLTGEPEIFSIKDSIRRLEEDVHSASTQLKGKKFLSLALAYYRDQDQEKAFTAFLDSLEFTQTVPYKDTFVDQGFYEDALKIYLDPHAQSTKETAEDILNKYGSLVKDHPDYTQLKFLVAASYANTGSFKEFFQLFYSAYEQAPNHYLAFKTKAIIHIKLLERADTLEKKDLERQNILSALEKAMGIYPQDHTLYKMTIAFSPPQKKQEVVNICLNKIININVIVPRTDLIFYIDEAVKTQQMDLAQKLLDKAREWYEYSRIINAAQQYLDQQKKG